jgi:hypothetical protein
MQVQRLGGFAEMNTTPRKRDVQHDAGVFTPPLDSQDIPALKVGPFLRDGV